MKQRGRPVATGHKSSLTDDVLEYQRTGSGYDDLMERIAAMVYEFPKRMRNATDDDCGDFYCYFMPRISKLIDRFVYRGREFEVYLIACMKWQYKSYITDSATEALSYATSKQAQFWPEYEHMDDPSAVSEEPVISQYAKSLLEIDATGKISNPIIARRLMLLALKASQEIDDEAIGRTASLIGTKPRELSEMIHSLNLKMDDRRCRRAMLRRRRDRAYFRMCYFQKRLLTEVDERRKSEYRRLMSAERTHLSNAREALSRVPVSPTHREIATLLDIPKGSVDSALYYMRNAFREPAPDRQFDPIGRN